MNDFSTKTTRDPQTELNPDSGRIQVLSTEKPPLNIRVEDIKTKIANGENLSQSEIDLFDQIANNLVGRVGTVVEEAKRGTADTTTYLKMLRIAEALGFGDTASPLWREEGTTQIEINESINEVIASSEVSTETGDEVEVDFDVETEVDVDFDRDPEMDEFMNISNNPAMVDYSEEKRQLKSLLDGLALEHHNRQLAREYAETKATGSRLGKLARAVAGVPGRIFHGLEGMIYPKAQIFRGMKVQKDNDKELARRVLEKELDTINSCIDSVSEYVDRSYGQTFSLDVSKTAEIQEFLDNCVSNPRSVHYRNTASITEEKIANKLFEYNAEIRKIDTDKSYQKNLEEMLNGSPASADQKATSGSWYLRAKERLNGSRNAHISTERPSWIGKKIFVPTLGAVINYGRAQQAQIHDIDKVPSQFETTVLTDLTKLKAQQKERRNKRIGWTAAAAAGLGLGLLGANGIYKSMFNKNKDAEVTSNIDLQRQAEKPLTQKLGSIDLTPTTKTDAKDQPKAGPVVTSGLPVVKPSKAKTIIAANKTGEKSDAVSPKTSREINASKPLNNAEKNAVMTEAQSKISAYKRLTATILGTDFPIGANDEETLLTLIDRITETLKTLHTHGELKTLEKTYDSIEAIFARLEKQRTAMIAPKYIANAELDSKIGLEKLTTIKSLMGGKTRFTIHHPVNQALNGKGKTETKLLYSVDLDSIGQKLAKIARETSVGRDRGLSETQAKLDAADAKYWVGYLNFVEWYAKYKVNDGKSVTF